MTTVSAGVSAGAPAGGNAGFTLLEVLVVLLILGLIVSGLVGSTRLGVAALGAQSRAAAEYQDLEPVDRALRRLVANIALPVDDRKPGLVGDPAGFACLTTAPAAEGPPLRVDAFVAADAAHRMVLRWSPHLHAERLAPRPAPAEEVLLQGIDRLEVSYLSPDRTGWLRSWSRTDLPALVRIQLLFAPGDPRHWPPIIAATQHSRARERSNG